jgi:hypothetical protein
MVLDIILRLWILTYCTLNLHSVASITSAVSVLPP